MVAAVKKHETDTDVVQKARMAFLVGVADMSWRLGLLFLTPVIIGYAIDQARNTDNAVIFGTFAGTVLSVLFIIKLGMEASRK